MGGSGKSAKPPTLDIGSAQQLQAAQYATQIQYLPKMAEAAGLASRNEYRANIDFGLGLLGNRSLRSRYEDALPEETARRAALLKQLDAAQESRPEYIRLQQQLQGSVGERAGMLTPEQQREATQSARAAMSARGMATGSSGLAAEILNRDRYMQQRRTQDLGILGQSAQLAEQERMRQIGIGQDSYNFGLASNPNMLAVGAGSPYANLTQPALAVVGSSRGLDPQYSGGQFSENGAGQWGSAASGALSGAAMGSAAGPYGAAAGAIIGGAAGYFSDERMKKNIKPLGKAGNVLGLTAYEFNYKDDAKNTPKRVGFMAKDVQKVLPGAVEEVNYKGKKRLAIKPAVIGAALAEELTNQTKAVAA